jgi:hypothetical protein
MGRHEHGEVIKRKRVTRVRRQCALMASEVMGAGINFAPESGTYTLNSRVTPSINNAGLGVDEYVSFVRNFYTQRGIKELILPPAN